MDAGCLIIDPKSPKLRRWDLYIMVLLIWTAVITPYEVAFTEPKLNVLFFINRLIDLSFGIVRKHRHSHPPHALTHSHFPHGATTGHCHELPHCSFRR